MICNKCNSQVPDGAKFCQNCGALMGAENKNFCENCGLELPKGAKFCTVCGAAVTKKSNAEVKPSDVLAPVTPIEPVSIAPAADLAKAAEEIGNSAVSVTANTEPAYSIPTSTSDFSMPEINSENNEQASAPTIFEQIEFGYIPEAPVISEAPAATSMPEAPVMPVTPVATAMPETPVTPVMPEPTGYSAAAASYSVPTAPVPTAAPTYAPAPDNQTENPMGNYGMGAAAVVAKPIKKKSVLKPILITLGAIIGAALIAAGVLFFVNKSFLFNLVLGNSGYAAMVEGNSIKDITNNIDVGAMSQGIKSATNSYANTLTQLSNYSSGITTTSVKPMMASTAINSSNVDFKTLINQLGDIMRETYGANSAKISMDFSAELTDTALAQLTSAMNCSSKDIEEILNLINNSGVSVDVTADGKALESTIEMTEGSLKINAKTVITEDGNAYLVLPFVSEKAFMIQIGSGYTASAGQVSDVCLELDEKELKRIIEKLVSIYIDVYKSSEITVKDGEISVAGATAKGKYISATLKGSNFEDLFKRVIEAFANDSYFCKQLSKFLGDCGMPITDAQIKSTLESVTKAIKIPDDSFTLVVETVTDNNCRVLAKSYSVSANGQSTKIAVVGDLNMNTKNGSTAAAAVEINDKPIASALFEKTSETDGVCTVTVYNDNSSVSAKVKYSGVKETTFNGKPAFEGTYEISMVLPADFTGAENADEISALISSAKIVMSVKIENDNTIKESVSFEIQQYGKLSANATLTIEDKPNGISIPSDVIDFTDAVNNGEMPENIQNEIIAYLKDLKNAVKNQNGGELGKALEEALTQLIDLAENGPTADYSDISDLMIDIQNDMSEVMEFDERYQNENEKLSNKAKILVQKYEMVLTQISEKNFKLTQNEYESFVDVLENLTEEKDALQKEFEGENPTAPGFSGRSSKADEIDFSTLDVTSLSEIFSEYAMRYSVVLQEYSSEIMNNSEMNALAQEVETTFETACDDFDNLMDVYKAGSLNLSLLRKARKSTNTFALAVEVLEQATATAV